MPETAPSVRASRVKLTLVAAVFLLPMMIAAALGLFGWQPGTRSHGEPIRPQRSLAGVRIDLAGGGRYAWRDSEPRMTLVALPGSECMDNCVRLLSLMRNARIVLNKNAGRLRLLYVGPPPEGATAKAVMPDWQVGRDVDGALRAFRPRGADTVSALLVESNGTALTLYRAGFDPNGLRKDLQKVIR